MGRLKTVSKDRLIVRLIIAAFVIFLAIIVFCNVLINSYNKFVINDKAVLESKIGGIRVGIVFGGGITEDLEPSDIVKDRLDAAVELYNSGTIDKIIVSGDNRFVNYNEPQVMQNYLSEHGGVPSYDIQQDNAGRSTYETCERAKKIFGLNEAVLISQNSHLPRAIFLCRSFGIDAYGYATAKQEARLSQNLRELGANIKAVFNVFVMGEKTILGEQIEL